MPGHDNPAVVTNDEPQQHALQKDNGTPNNSGSEAPVCKNDSTDFLTIAISFVGIVSVSKKPFNFY